MKTVKVRPRRTLQPRLRKKERNTREAKQLRNQKWIAGFFVALVIAPLLHFLSSFTKDKAIADPFLWRESPQVISLQYILLSITLILSVRICIRWLCNKLSSPWDNRLLLVLWICLSTYYVLSFQPALAPNGDNAEYIINAKSLVKHGSALRLDTPHDTPNTLASLGLPLMLAPIYALWGQDIVKMKILIMICGLLTFPALYHYFKRSIGNRLSLLIATVSVGSPYVLASSTMIMTEIPYLLSSVLVLIICDRYVRSARLNLGLGLAVLLGLVLVYQMRAVGLALTAAVSVVLLQTILREVTRKQGEKLNLSKLMHNSQVHKLLFIAIPGCLAVLVLQSWQSEVGISQVEVLFGSHLTTNLWIKVKGILLVLGPMIFDGETFLWASFAPGIEPPTLGIASFMLATPVWVGLFQSVSRGELTGWYVLLCLVVIAFGSRVAQEMVIMRYLVVLIPFMLYLHVLGLLIIIRKLWPRTHRTQLGRWPQILCSLILVQILLTNAGSNAFTIARAHIGYGENYNDLIAAARWAGKYLPADALVASVKPRIFYLYSNCNGIRLLTSSERQEGSQKTKVLERWNQAGVTHVLIDQLSSSSKSIAAPIIESSPHLFEKIANPSTHGSATIYKLRRDKDS